MRNVKRFPLRVGNKRNFLSKRIMESKVGKEESCHIKYCKGDYFPRHVRK